MSICIIFTDAEKAAIIGGVFSVIGFLLIIIVQNNLIKRNQFESTFFNLLSNIREMSNSIRGEFGAESLIRIAENAKKPPSDDDYAYTGFESESKQAVNNSIKLVKN